MDHQQRIEDAFDRAELCELLGDLELAVEWLDEAAALSGGLSRDFRAKRTRWLCELARPEASRSAAKPTARDPRARSLFP